MLTIGRLGAGGRSAEYYLDRAAGCEADYYLAAAHRGRWELTGARALGLTGPMDPAGEQAFRALLTGCGPDGTRLVGPVLRADPRGRLPARLLVEAITARAAERGVPVRELLVDARLLAVFEAAAGQVEVDRHLPRRPRAGLPADLAGRLATAAGLDPAVLYAGPDDPDRYATALAHVEDRVDVRRAGLDLTFSAPKSVSVLFALADPDVAGQVRAAHAEAVRQSMDYLQSRAARVVRGHVSAGQPPTYLATDGLVGASFEHVTSRAGDPQVHTHVVVANLARGTDGRWSAVDTSELYRQAQTGGYLYQAVLRAELTRRLGVGWGPVRRGVAEIDGIGPGLRRVFSQRRAQIDAELARTGRSGPKAAQVAAWRSRAAKTHEAEPTLRQRWATRAAEAGTEPARLVRDVLHRPTRPHRPTRLPGPDGAVRDQPPTDPTASDLTDLTGLTGLVAGRLLGERGVTARRASFDRRELLRAVCEAVPAGTDITVGQLRALATAIVRNNEVVPLAAAGQAAEPAEMDARRYSTASLLAVEQAALDRAAARATDGLARLPAQIIEHALAGSSLTAEQAAVVRRLLTSGAGVQVVHGPAGAGKTATLAVARQLWAAAGIDVRGAAVAAIAARTLTEGSGIPAGTITQLLHTVDRRPAAAAGGAAGHGLPAGGVLVVDEAGMVGTRALARLIELTAQSGTLLVLVGDPFQLPEIDAGGLFTALADVLPAAGLTGNVRQRQDWERAALQDLRAGDVLAGVGAYQQAGRVHLGDSIPALREQLVTDYLTAAAAHRPGQVLMLAVRRADVRALNTAARAQLLAAGQLGPDRLLVDLGPGGSREFRVGDQIVVTANDYRRGLINGQRGHISALRPGRDGGADIRTSDGGQLPVPASALRAGTVEHGYALTVHRAQGVTVEVALLFASGALTREAGYVGMSRGRGRNELYTSFDALSPDQADPDQTSIRGIDPVRAGERAELTDAALVARLETRRAQRLATRQLQDTARARQLNEQHRASTNPARSAHRRGR